MLLLTLLSLVALVIAFLEYPVTLMSRSYSGYSTELAFVDVFECKMQTLFDFVCNF